MKKDKVQKKVFITGITGFIAKALSENLINSGQFIVCGSSRSVFDKSGNPCIYKIPELSRNTNWSHALKDIDVVVHAAARAHILNDTSVDPMKEFHEANVEGSIRLAREAIENGVKRFVYISSIGVNGSHTLPGEPFNENMEPFPVANYALSKFEAEEKLREITKNTEMELVIIRPPLVFAHNAPGNFQRLLKLVKKRLPLPLHSVKNQRSLISLGNLVDFLSLCVTHDKAANETFLIADNEDISTADLIRIISEGMSLKPLLFPTPVFLLKLGAKLIGKESMFTQLTGSLLVNNAKAKKVLGWSPRIDTHNGLLDAARKFLEIQQDGYSE